MRALLLAVVLVVAAAQNSCNVFPFGTPPPDFADYGSCKQGVPLLDGETCSIVCLVDGRNNFALVGTPYHCTNGVRTGSQKCVFQDYVPGAKNCTVSAWSSAQDTGCNFGCGDATKSRTRLVTSYGEAGGVPCPIQTFVSPCLQNPNQLTGQNCHSRMYNAGYMHWGPFCAGATDREISYWFNTLHQNVDFYLFDQTNFNRYTWDASLSTPQNSYYYPVFAYMQTDYESSSFVVPAGKCYVFVLDNTNVGPTKANTNANNGDGFDIYYQFHGMTPADGFSDYSMLAGYYQPASAFRASISFFGAFVTIVLMLLLQ